MGKKFLVLGIVSISISVFFIILWLSWYLFIGRHSVSPPQSNLGIIIIGGVFLIAGIFLLKKHFRTRKTQKQFEDSPAKSKAVQTQGDTQFWACPVCGNDTKEYHGRSYCDHCERYL